MSKDAVTDREKAHVVLHNPHALRVAYERYIERAPWVPFERFEMGVAIVAGEVYGDDHGLGRPA